MNNECRPLNQEETAILSTLKGERLNQIDACIVARDDTAWGNVRLHLDGADIDICIQLGEAVVDEAGESDEFGFLSVKKTSRATLEVAEASPETTVIQINDAIKDMTVVNERINIYSHDMLVSTIETTQAIILQLNDSTIALDRECWFSDTLTLKQTEPRQADLYDDSLNWANNPEEEPDCRYDVSYTYIDL